MNVPTTRLPAARRRQQLLDVALEVFAERGFHPTSMNDLAEAAGVTKPVLYQHFGSKRELYLELLEDVGTRLRDAIGKATSEAAGPREQVEQGFRAYFRFVADHQRRLPGALRRRHPARRGVRRATPAGSRSRSPTPSPRLIEIERAPRGRAAAARPRHRRPRRGHQPPLAARRRRRATPTSSPPGSPSWPGPASAASDPLSLTVPGQRPA